MGCHQHDLQWLETWVVENPWTTLLRPWEYREMFKKVVTLTNPAREFGFVTYVGRIFNIIIPHDSGWLISPLLIFLLLVLPFLLLLSLLVTSIKDFTRKGRRKGRRHDG
jgi:hypothetical protein